MVLQFYVTCPLGSLFSFLFGKADQSDVVSLKQQVKQLYQNQLDQTKTLNDIITITNISRGLIKQNILKVNSVIETGVGLNETVENIRSQLTPLFTARRFFTNK